MSNCVALQAEPYRPRYVDPWSESWRIRAFPQLKGRELKCIAEDSGGAIWFGVAAGAVRFDGLHWDEFSASTDLPGPAIAFAQAGTQFYAATRSSVHVLNGGGFRKVFPTSDRRAWVIEDLAAGPDGTLWASTDLGAVELHGNGPASADVLWQRIRLFTTPEIGRHLQDQKLDDSIEIETVAASEAVHWRAGLGVCVYGQAVDENAIVAVAENGPADNAGIRVGDRIVGIDGEPRRSVYQRELEDSPGTRIRLKVLPYDSDEVTELELECESIEGRYQRFRPLRIVVDPHGTVWFATRLGRIYSLHRDQTGAATWTNHTRQHNLPVVAMPSIAATTEGVAAVGRNTATESLIRYDGTRWTVVDLPRALGSSIESADDGSLLVGTNGAVLSVETGGRVVDHNLRDYGIFGNDTIVKRMSDGAVWIAGKGSIALRMEPQGKRWTSYQGLVFQDSGDNDTEWFLTDRLAVVRRQGERWQQYDASDGLMTQPLRVIATKSGDVWAAGSHDGVASTARMVGGRWERHLHPELSWAVDRRAVFEDREQRLWFGAAVNQQVQEGERGGVLRFDGTNWKHFPPTNRLDFVYGIAQTRDGSVWFAGPSLVEIRPDDRFGSPSNVPLLARGFSDALCNDSFGNLWIGTRSKGVVKLNARTRGDSEYEAIAYDESSGISNNRIKSLLTLPGANVMIGTPAGFDRFDGQTWGKASLPPELAYETDYGGLHQGQGEQYWFNASGLSYMTRDLSQGIPLSDLGSLRERFTTYHYRPDRRPPETILDRSASENKFGEIVSLSWSGTDYLDTTPRDQLTYSWRLDDRPWSAFSPNAQVSFRDLPVGTHHVRVRARDADFNIDATPAVITFEVLPALWQQSWFQGLWVVMAILFGLAIIQTGRVFRREASLRTSNRKLLLAEQDLQRVNQNLESRVAQRTRELREANQQLHASEVQYRSIVEDQSEYIVRFDADRQVTFVNSAYLRANRVLGQTAIATLPADAVDRLRRVIAGVKPGMQHGNSTVSYQGHDGQLRWEQWHCRVLSDQVGNRLGYQVVGNDITDLRLAQNRLSEKELELAHLARVSALGEMVAGISHEINQPLATIANFSSASLLLLEREQEDGDSGQDRGQNSDQDNENVRQWIARIKEQTQRINKIVNSLRRFGRPGSNLAAFDLESAVFESLALCEYQTRSVVEDLRVEIPEDLPRAYADRVQIEQVLVNLIRNAVDAMDDPAVVNRTLKITAVADQNSLKVSVIDSGPGIPKERAEEIFQTFVTTKTHGMGMGLAISRSIIESHRGKLYTIDSPDGAWFEFTLPTANDHPAAPSSSQGLSEVPKSDSLSV
ncbi:ATP-binding protein [Stieleria maiorica]|uniref:ATP-binding protein n=1 Tax=Stieleria maiorica TaxID=2795974 RepID=UPI00142F387C|nr:ATP-binding protein [Stieleria maiorica]